MQQASYNKSTSTTLNRAVKSLHQVQLHPFNGLFTRTTWVNQYQKNKTSLDLNEARDDGVVGWQWHHLDHMQTICTSLQTYNHTNTPSLNFFTDWMLFLVPNQQGQRTESKYNEYILLRAIMYDTIAHLRIF